MITVNGNKMEWTPGLKVDDILKKIENKFPIVVVKVNGKHISKKDYNSYEVPDNSEIYIIDIINVYLCLKKYPKGNKKRKKMLTN